MQASPSYLLTEPGALFSQIRGRVRVAALESLPVDFDGEVQRDLGSLVVPSAGSLVATGDRWEPYRLVDGDGAAVEAVALFFRDLQAAGRSPATVRSYGLDLLRWFRFLWAIGVSWERATRAEARDFSRWLLVAGKPIRSHWRSTDAAAPTASGVPYAASVRAHSETVLRCFYDFHLAAASGPVLINPFPLVRTRRKGRANAHHSPMEQFRAVRALPAPDSQPGPSLDPG